MKKIDLPVSHENNYGKRKPLFDLYVEEKKDSSFAHILENEQLLRKLIQEQPEKGFEIIFKQYYSPLCNLAVRYVYSKEIAEDIVSDIFLDFWKNKRYEAVVGSFRTYLYQSVRYKTYSYLKKDFGNKAEAITDKDFDALVENSTPQKTLLFDELNNRINESVSSFSPQCLNVFLLSRFEGKKNREIAEELGIKLKTVESHMMKALFILRKSLMEYLK